MTNAKHITLFAVGLLLAMSAKSQQEYLVNRQFDSTTAGWSHESISGSGSVDWDGAVGSPGPGSLRISASGPIAGQLALGDTCFLAAPGSLWTLTAQAREDVGSDPVTICGVALRVYTTTDCSIPSYTTIESNPALFNNWTTTEVSVENLFGGVRGIKPVLFNSIATAADGICHFDDVSLTGPPLASTIPTLGASALAILATALVFAGAAILRRSTGATSPL